MSQEYVNWGILGTSPISEKIARAILESGTSKLAAVGGHSLHKAKNFAETFSIDNYYDDYQALLDDDELDAIYIGLPNYLHAEWIIRCAKAGKHILCEKPFVTSIWEAHEAIAAVKTAKVFCMEALMYRCHPFTAKLREIIQNKVIGDIKLINATYMADIAKIANPVRGGCILNLGCYPVSLVRLLIGKEPVEITALNIQDAKKQDRQASLLMKFDHEILAVVNTADHIGTYTQFNIFGTQGHLNVITNPWMPTRENNRIMIYRNDETIPFDVILNADKSLYTYEIDAVNQRILQLDNQKIIDIVSLEDSWGNMAVLEAWQNQANSENGRIDILKMNEHA